MGKILTTIAVSLFSVAAAAQSADGIAASGVKMTRSGGGIVLEMTVSVAPDAVPVLQGVELVPVLSDGAGHSFRFPGVLVNGRGRMRIYRREKLLYPSATDGEQPFRVVELGRGNPGATVEYSVRAEAEEWMEGASLSFVYVLISPAGERHSYSSPAGAIPAAE
jgi:hypothetical protein